jgi:hypothetical protein
MSTIVTRTGKGSALSYVEVDSNFTNLNTDKVQGGASSTDNAVARYDSTTGKLLQNSLVTIADDGAITAPSVGSVIPFYYANQAAFPSAATYHGAIVHSHADAAMYFAHSSAWVEMLKSGGALGTPASGTLTNCTVDGTNPIGYRDLPAVGTKTSSYTLAVGDVGKYVQVGASGSITIPDATFAEGDAISIFNNTSGNITITCSITTAYIAGTDADKATVTLATRGIATVLFISGTVCAITGNVS